MKAVVYSKYGSPEVLELNEVDPPVPKDNEVLIRIHATTVSAVDSIFRSGKSIFARFATGLTKPKKLTLGSDFAGEIEAIGRNVTRYKKGDRVFGDNSAYIGSHAEYICLSEDAPMVAMPSDMTFEEASAVPYGALTALPFLRDNGQIRNGQKVLIIGASGAVGVFAVQLAKYYGAEVTGVCSTANVEMVKSLGANRIIDYKKEDFTSSGEKYDIIFDTVGKSSFSKCKGSLKDDGIFLTTVLSVKILLQMLWTSRFKKKKAVIAFTGLRPADAKKKDLAFVKNLLAEKKVKPVIDRSYPLDQIADAHRYVDNGHKKGSVVINMKQNGAVR